jgi:acetolactate synthase-1/2/3 large subunit
VECLKAEGVDVIFGLPGGVVLPVYDVLYDSDIKHILVRHEQGAAHMADGYSRATGRCGVALVTSGPGATNTVTGIATAYMDSIPMVIFTGQVNSNLIGNDAFQEADIIGITRPCTKHSYLVRDTRELAQTIKEAFYIAMTGKPGPVLVDLPRDVMVKEVEYIPAVKPSLRSYNPTVEGHMAQVKKAFEKIKEAKKPVLYVGGGMILANASAEMARFAMACKIPVTTTLMALGSFNSRHELALGMLGMHGTYAANMAMHEADLVVALGARFDDRVTGRLDAFAPNSEKIHVDIDPTSISKNVTADVPVVGDLLDVMKKFNSLLDGDKTDWDGNHREWLKTVGEWKSLYPLRYDKSPTGVIKPQYVVEELCRAAEGKDAIYTTEVGQAQMWAAQFINFDKPRTFLTSGGLGTMGYGLPAAIGAQAAYPDRLVVDVAGDGSIQMNIQELATAVQYGLNVKVAILNNGCLGMVRQWQELFYKRRYSFSDLASSNPDFVKLAEAYGAVGLRATKESEVKDVIKQAYATNKPVIMDFVVEREEKVFPMVPGGGTVKDIILM